MIWLDEYERHARLAPGLLALLPVPIDVLALGLRSVPIASTLVSLLTAVGGPIVLASFVRQRGLRLQEELYRRWGCPPTTLRLRDTNPGDALRTQRRHEVARVASTTLPTAADEGTDPEGADSRYEAAVAVLRQKAGKSTLVSAENRGYGFERNLVALRPVGIGVAVSGLFVLVGAVVLRVLAAVHSVEPLALALGVLLDVALTALWLWYPAEARVLVAGGRYADQLLDAASVL